MSNNLWFRKYEIVGVLGEGATSKVYLAIHTGLLQKRAIKCISKSHQSAELAKKEANLLIQLKSPAIPIVYDVEEDESHLYIIEEYMEGESLLSYRLHSRQLSESFLLKLALQICQLIKYLHSLEIPILYLDLKPANFRIQDGQLKLIDFGAARYKYDSEHRCNYGSVGYAAPEQYMDTDLSEKCDIYGIGMLLYFLITGEVESNKGNIKNIYAIKGYSKELLELVANCMKHNPCERYSSVQALEKKLTRCINHSRKQKSITNSSKTIALIGSQRHVGVTHLAFYLLSYLTKKGYKVIYVERNLSHVVAALAMEKAERDEFLIRYRNCTLTKAEWLNGVHLNEYDYVIFDYGESCNSVQKSFLQADIRIVVLSGRVWEKEKNNCIIQSLQLDTEVKYVLNHQTAGEFYQTAKRFKKLPMYRMPQECDPFTVKSKVVNEFAEIILS